LVEKHCRLLGGNQNANFGSCGAWRRASGLRVRFVGYCAGLHFAGPVPAVQLPAARPRGPAVSTRAASLSGVQDSKRTSDGVATAAAIVVFWPAAFFVGGDKQTAAELAQMKGQMVAIEQASIAKKCNIQFQGKPPGT
jgi:hypothetical protein